MTADLSGQKSSGSDGPPKDLTAEYLIRDLHTELIDGVLIWLQSTRRRYGGVIFDDAGRILLREPANHFDGFRWTFPKGAPDQDEHPVDTALREVFEETGLRPFIVGLIPGAFVGGTTGSTNFFYLMRVSADHTTSAVAPDNPETWSTRWVEPDEAAGLISESTNPGGRARDLQTLAAARAAYDLIQD